MSVLDISSNRELVDKFKTNCYVGLRLVVAVTSVKKEPHRVVNLSRVVIENAASGQFSTDLTRSISVESIPNSSTAPSLKAGDLISGIIYPRGNPIGPPALQVQLGRVSLIFFHYLFLAFNRSGRLCVTEVEDIGKWVTDYSHLYSKSDEADITSGEIEGLETGKILSFRVLSVPTNGPVELSLRPSRLVDEIDSC
jgi:hypothetical protein